MAGGAAASSRARRAQLLRQQRAKKGGVTKGKVAAAAAASNSGAAGDDEDDDTLVISGACTLITSFLIVCMGAGMATLFFSINQPDCIKGLSFEAAAKSFAPPDGASISLWSSTPAKPANEVATEPSKLRRLTKIIPTAEYPKPNMPEECNASQMDVLAKQLPGAGCEKFSQRAWRKDGCSFSAASSCSHSTWFEDYISKRDFPQGESFLGIIVGCNKGYGAMRALEVASGDNKYDQKKWKSEFLNTNDKVIDSSDGCPYPPLPSVTSNGKKAQVYCLEPIHSTYEQLVKTKQALNIPDEALIVDQIALAMTPRNEKIPFAGEKKPDIGIETFGFTNWKKSCFKVEDGDCVDFHVDSFDHWIKGTSISETAPIHYLSLDVEGHEYEVLVGSARNLLRTHYIDLKYHWFGDWNKRTLQEMVNRMEGKGFACYFSGSENKLWRITGCWQDHYQHRFWSSIGCVNTNAAPQLSEHMEKLFAQTLATPNLQFGS